MSIADVENETVVQLVDSGVTAILTRLQSKWGKIYGHYLANNIYQEYMRESIQLLHISIAAVLCMSCITGMCNLVSAACSWVVNIIILSSRQHASCTCVYVRPLLNEIKLQLCDTTYAQCSYNT